MFQLTDGTKTITARAVVISTGLTLSEDSTGLPVLTASGGSSSSVDWPNITNKPTTVAGYGITDALTTSYVPAWSSVSGKPTTISGYGLTDAVSKAGDTMTGALSHTLGSASVTAASSAVSGDTTSRWYRQADGSMAWGSGTAATDVSLYRSNVNELTTGSHFVSGGNINASGYIRAQGSYGLALGEVTSVPRIRFGASGATSFDFLTGGNANAGIVAGALTAKNSYSATSTTATDLTIGGGGASPNAASITWGDGSGWQLVLGTRVAGAFASRFTFTDGGAFFANGQITGYTNAYMAGALYLGFQLTGAATGGLSSGDLVVQRSATTGYVYFGGNLTKTFGHDGAKFLTSDALYVPGTITSRTGPNTGAYYFGDGASAVSVSGGNQDSSKNVFWLDQGGAHHLKVFDGSPVGYNGSGSVINPIFALSESYTFGYGATSVRAGSYGLVYSYDTTTTGGLNFTNHALGWGFGHIENAQMNGYLGASGWWCRNNVYIGSLLSFLNANADAAYLGVAQSAGAVINGSAVGDLCIRAVNQRVLLSANNGTSANAYVATDGMHAQDFILT